MASRRHEQRPYSTLHLSEEDNAHQYYQHPAQASQFSLHTPTDPNPPNSSFRSPISPRLPSEEFPPRSPGFLQMEQHHQQQHHQQQQQQPTSSVQNTRRLTRVFDGDESPVEPEFNHHQLQDHEQLVQQSRLEYSDPEQGIDYTHQPQGHEQEYQGHHQQQYQGHEQYHQSPTEYHQQPQEQEQEQELQYQQSSPEYLHQQGYDAHTQSQYSTPLPSPGFPQSQFDPHSQANPQFARRTSQQFGPAPQYISPPHSPSFPPPPRSPSFLPPQHSPSFPPPPRSATFTPPNLSFPPPPHSPSFPPPPHSPSFPPPPHSPSFPPPPHSPSFSPPPHSPSFSPPPHSPSFPPPPQSPSYPPHTPSYAPHTPTFPPPPTSEIYQPSVPIMPSAIPISTATPPPGGQGVELITRPPIPPAPIGTPAYNPALEGPKTPIYTPGGGSGPNGGTHAPGQIGHPNQQIGKEEYSHGLCDCFSEFSTCCVGYWCPCILYSRTNHRLKTSPNSNLNDFHNCNGHCVGFCVLAPISWIFTLIQRGRIRDKYKLEGTVMSDCGKAYCCVMCTLVQDEREVTEREDERRRNAGPGSGVVGEGGYRRHDSMVYGRS